MTGLCVSTYTFGEYSAYIAPYIYFLKRSYPDCFPIIFNQNHLSSQENDALNLLAKEFAFDVIEGYFKEKNFSRQRGSAVRWLLWDKRFEDYEGVYVGDIDIYICQEPIPLLKAHLDNCNKLQLPFSNAIRLSKPFTPKKTELSFAATKRYKDEATAELLFNLDILPTKRMTGLHFFIPNSYKNLFFKYYEKFYSILINDEELLWHQDGFHNETFLYDMIEDFEFINRVPKSKNYSLDDVFRPTHGIHSGRFRQQHDVCSTINQFFSQEQKNFYFYFIELTQKDPLFAQLEKFLSPRILYELEQYRKAMRMVTLS